MPEHAATTALPYRHKARAMADCVGVCGNNWQPGQVPLPTRSKNRGVRFARLDCPRRDGQRGAVSGAAVAGPGRRLRASLPRLGTGGVDARPHVLTAPVHRPAVGDEDPGDQVTPEHSVGRVAADRGLGRPVDGNRVPSTAAYWVGAPVLRRALPGHRPLPLHLELGGDPVVPHVEEVTASGVPRSAGSRARGHVQTHPDDGRQQPAERPEADLDHTTAVGTGSAAVEKPVRGMAVHTGVRRVSAAISPRSRNQACT